MKARKEFELQQHEFRHEAQQKQSALEQSELLVLLRGTQLDHYRALLEEREQSVQREHELLAESRRMLEDSLGKNRRRLQSERETWEQERQAQRAEVRRQQDVLALHAENLEGRRSRLDQLRTELEETHRHTLEMRMAVEETCAQLAQSAGADVSQERIEIARRALSEHYSKLHEAVSRQQQETDEALVLFQKQKDEFRVERQTLTEWIAERDERIQLREEEVCRDAASLESREVEWRAAREVWMNEKLEAETVIRGLLQQLTVANDPNAATDT